MMSPFINAFRVKLFSMPMPCIAIDIDGTICNTTELVLSKLRNKYGIHFSNKIDYQYSLEIACGLTKREILDTFTEVIVMDSNSLYLYDYVPYVLSKLKREGVDFDFVTSRPKHLERQTHKWLDSLPDVNNYNRLIFADRETKIRDVEELHHLYIEDDPYVAIECGAQGLPVFLLDQPWNEGLNPNNYYIRMESWKSIGKAFGFGLPSLL